jgi:hypothetical protein
MCNYMYCIGWGVDLFDFVQNRDRWWAFVNAVMKLRFAQTERNSWLLNDCVTWGN